MEICYTAQTSNTGKGVFAARDITAGEHIFDFEGALVTADYDIDYDTGDRWVGIGKNQWINTNPSNPGYYINHSCQPNAGLKDVASVYAIKDIAKDEEIVFDYSTSEEDPFWQMECNCGAENCRVIIKNIQSLSQQTFNSYLPFITDYFQGVYKNATSA